MKRIMKRIMIVFIAMFAVIATNRQLQIKASGVKWDENYSFDKCNVFQVEAYAKNNELMKTMHFKTYYQTEDENFMVKLVTEGKGNGMETVLDKKIPPLTK